MITALVRAARSEVVRLRPMWKMPAAALLLTALATALAFSGSSGGATGRTGPTGGASADTSSLEAADGITAGVETAGTLVALLCLALWALSVARDLQTGSIRVLLVTEARRLVYFGGKLSALVTTTVATAVAAVGVSVGIAAIAASANDISSAAWQAQAVASSMLNLSITALLWGATGAALAMLFRSSAAAIAGGVGYLLLGERLIALIWSKAESWLPNGTSTSVLSGGTDTTSYTHAVALTLGYLAIAVMVSLTAIARRDVTD